MQRDSAIEDVSFFLTMVNDYASEMNSTAHLQRLIRITHTCVRALTCTS